MNKILAGGVAGIILLGGAAVGGSLYADKQLNDTAYSPALMQRSFGLANFRAQTDMGAFSGTAQWQGDFIPNPCHPESKITIRGTDTLHRSFSGYQIDSKVYLVSDSAELKNYLPEGFLFDASRQIAWNGNVQAEISIPARSIQQNTSAAGRQNTGMPDIDRALQQTRDTTLSWQNIRIRLSLHKENNELIPTDFHFTLPALEVKSGQSTFSLQNLRHHSRNAFLGYGSIQPGSSETSLAALTFRSPPGTSIALSNLKTNSRQSISGQTVAWDSKFEIDRIEITQPIRPGDDGDISAQPGKHIIDGIRFNTDLQNISLPAIQSFSDLLARQRHTCIPPGEMQDQLSGIAISILNGGLSIQSAGNQIRFDGAPLNIDAELALPAASYSSLDDIQPLMSSLQYRADIRIDTGFIAAVGRAFADWSNKPYNEDNTRQAIEKLLAQPQAKQEGNTIRLTYRQP